MDGYFEAEAGFPIDGQRVAGGGDLIVTENFVVIGDAVGIEFFEKIDVYGGIFSSPEQLQTNLDAGESAMLAS